ncbi:MAG: M42 family metallopeptidase [Chloroflexi bacterium]|nr:M42 family metallopeptidase [Chloroflexota bacterium]
MSLLADLLALAALDAPPGREDAVRDAVRRAAEAHGFSARTDALGNLIVGPDEPRLAVFVPLDEIGFVVHAQGEGGFWRVAPLGPVAARVAAYQPVRFLDGGHALLVPEADAPEALRWEHLLADATSPLTLAAWGVWDTAPRMTHDGALGKAVASRALVAIALQLWEVLSLPDEVTFVFAARTWTPGHGEGPAAYGLRPRQMLRLRPAPTQDRPPRRPGGLTLGSGPGLALRDENRLADARLLAWMEDLAREAELPWQAFVPTERTWVWTSAPRVAEGVPTLTVVLPTRYLTSPYERIMTSDAEALLAWLKAALTAVARAPYS